MAKEPKQAGDDLKDDTNYDVKLSRPIQWGGGRPLRPDQTHHFAGHVIKKMRADANNDGAIEVLGETKHPV